MITPMNDEAFKNTWTAGSADRMKTIIDLSAAHVLTDSDLIDQVITQIFDQLSQMLIEVRVSNDVLTAGDAPRSVSLVRPD